MKRNILLIFLSLSACLTSAPAMHNSENAYIFSTIDRRQGLSNSAVICIFKDDAGLMWFGTYDGVNCFDSREMEIFRADFSTSPTLDNNVIYGISRADGNYLWISTLLGINRFSLDNRRVVANYTVSHGTSLRSNSRGDTWLVSSDSVAYYNTLLQRFTGIYGPDITVSDPVSRSFVADDGVLWLFPDSEDAGDVYKISLNAFDSEESEARLNISSSRFHPKAIENIFCQNDVSFCFVDAGNDLYMYDIGRRAKVRIRNIGSLLEKYGPITDVVPFYDDFIIAFKTNGLMRLKMSELYAEEIIDQDLRVFYVYKDPVQGILWIGVDGKGAMMYTKRHSIATNLMMHNFSRNFTRQVRSVMTDRQGGLWFGTKGDGLIHLSDYAGGMDPDKATIYFPGKIQAARTYTREDTEFPVFSLRQSSYMDGFWIGSGAAGLFYHKFGDGRIHGLASFSGEQYDEIHEIHEANDSTLYIAAAGSGFRKLTLDRRGTGITVKRQEQYHFFNRRQEIRTFFAMIPEGDSILWLGSRESGVIRFNTATEEYRVISLRDKLNRTVDDVLCICRAKNGDMFIGTTAGLVKLSFAGKEIEAQYTGREQGLLNDMIHGILEDVDGFLWLSTNKGLIKYNPANGSSHAYYYSGGVQIGEFSDDAYYKCPYTGRLFFGGIDGLLYIDKNAEYGYDYYPDILLRRLFFGRDEANLADYYTDDGSAIRFRYTNRSFTLSFIAPDFISGADIEYSWMLENHDKDWQPFGTLNEASYSGLPVGNYIFSVRYRKDIFDTDFQSFSIPVRVLPLWYQTAWARLLFTVLGIVVIMYFILMLKRFIKNKRLISILQESENKNTSDKTACMDPDAIGRLTSIYHACDFLKAGNTTDEQRYEKIEQIREQVMSMLLPAGIFSKSEPSGFIPVRFTIAGPMSIREISDEVSALLRDRGIDMNNVSVDIPESFSFSVYRNAIRCLFCYIYVFVTGARRTTPFSVHASVDGTIMTLTFASARGILKKLHESLVDEGYRFPLRSPDDDFGIRLLHRLVMIVKDQLNPAITYSDTGSGAAELSLSFNPAVPEKTGNDKKSVLLLEDHDEMYWLISDILSTEYVVHKVRSIQHALELIKQSSPVVFLVDMTMYADAENTFMEFINRNGALLSKTAFIPMLTWKTTSSMQRKLILLADSYLILPYDIVFLKEIVHKTIYGRKEAKQIYIEGLGDFANLITCTTEEQVGFIRRMVAVIEENIDREDLGSTFIADRMAMSPRQFYRKFKEISGLPPTELIKNYRMEKAAALLLDNELSINDVIAEIGIASRSYFYKEFTRKFGMTPKDYRDSHRTDPDRK